jgi:outer membrane protein assembly factor BamB
VKMLRGFPHKLLPFWNIRDKACRRVVKLVAILLLLAQWAHAGDWPQWLGPKRDGHASLDSPEITRLPSEPKVSWRKPIGGGFSSPVVANGKVIYFDENGTNEVTHELDAATGKEIWKTAIGDVYRDEWSAGPRSTPIVDGAHVYVQSCKGEFRCLDFATGDVIWGFSFDSDFNVKFLGSRAQEGTAARRGNNGTGIVDGDAVLVPVGSTNNATIVCFDKNSGKKIWQVGTDEAAYSSIQVADLAGTRHVILLNADALMGVSRKDGKLLWRVPLRTNAKRHAATPVINGDDIILNSHTFGLIAIRVKKSGDTFETARAWSNPSLKINLSTPVLVGGYLYSQGPSRNFICADAKNGELKWEAPNFGKENSSTISVGKNLLVLTDGGELVLVAANPTAYKELGRQQVCGKNWNFPAFADGKLYVRDARELLCLNLLQ